MKKSPHELISGMFNKTGKMIQSDAVVFKVVEAPKKKRTRKRKAVKNG